MFFPRLAEQGIHQTGFTHFAFADDDEFSFVEYDLSFCIGTQVGFDSFDTLFVCFGKFGIEGIVIDGQVD